MSSYLNHITHPGNGAYALFAIPAGWAIAMAPHFYAAAISTKSNSPFDNKNPRLYLAKLQQKEKLTEWEAKYIRAEAAQQNGHENLGLFSASLIAGVVARLDPALLKGLATSYLISRIVYNYVYINNNTDTLATLRSVSFLSGIGIIFTLFIKSGLALGSTVA